MDINREVGGTTAVLFELTANQVRLGALLGYACRERRFPVESKTQAPTQ